jgi:putative tryptophan/tyrosine transport system substrate-binding protein
MDTTGGWENPYGAAIRQAAKAAHIVVTAVWSGGKIDEAEYEHVFAAFEQNRPDALIVPEQAIHLVNAATIVKLAAKHRLPAMYTQKGYVEIGGLMAYSPDLEELGRSTGYQIGQILNGINPGDLPYNQVTRYELALNLKTAKSLGIEFPATLLGSADFIIE